MIARLTICEQGLWRFFSFIGKERRGHCTSVRSLLKYEQIFERTGVPMNIVEKLEILADAAKYDVACTSSGVDRAGSARPAGKRNGRRVLPQLHTRWALHLASEGAHDQRLHLRLRLLRESCKQRSRAHRVHPARAGRPDDIVLPTQLYRRAVRKLRRHKKPGLHDRAHDSRRCASCATSTAFAGTSTRRRCPAPHLS